ncbi:MAG: hypothetical protein AB8B55_18925 [Mariniblastus sp.]
MRSVGPPVLGLALILGIALLVSGEVQSVRFVRGCSGHLKRAADANTIELAEKELKIAVDYIEANGLTTGTTSVLYSMPKCELDFWYENLKASLEELQSTPDDADRLTISNQLIKLRETIVDQREKGARVTIPPNAHVFPNQVLYRTLGFASLAGLLIGGVGTAMLFDKPNEKCS